MKPDPTVNTSYRGVIATEIPVADLMMLDVYRSRNKAKTWKNIRYPKIDPNFIVISKDGTIGKIFKVGGLIIALPSSEGKEILNLSDKREDSVWKRTEIPKEFIALESEYKRDMRKYKYGKNRANARNRYRTRKYELEAEYEEFIEKEFYRREHGLFIKIDEEIVYITGSNYMFLTYYYLTEENMYPYFRITATHTWWHWAACQADPTCWGELRLKSRRISWSCEVSSEALNFMNLYKYSMIPVVSENDRLARILFVEKIVKPYKYYPTYFKAILEDPNVIAQSVLEIEFDTDDRETSNISFYPTKAVAYDSTKAHPMSINDEIGKFVNVEFTEFRGNHRDCHFRGLTTVVSTGKFGSTAGAFSSGGESLQYEYENANPLVRDKLGSTNTGLISLFVDDCYTSGGFFDLWGYPIVTDPTEPILNEDRSYVEYGAITAWDNTYEKLKELGKKRDLNNFLRQHPREVEHAFRAEGGKNNDFDIDNLNNHADFLKKKLIFINETVFVGDYAWQGEPYASPVAWRPNPNGKFKTTWIPEPDKQNNHSIKLFRGTVKLQTPSNRGVGSFGIDSYDIDDTVDGKGSNGAIAGLTKMNMFGAPSNSFFLMYCDRPNKRDYFYDDVAKCLWFYGFQSLIESNKPRLLEWLTDHGMRAYSMTRPDKKWRHLSDTEKKYGGIPSSKQGNSDQASLLQDYIYEFVGSDLENDCKVWHLDLIEEWIRFNVKKRKAFDMSVAAQLALLANQYMPRQRVFVSVENSGGSRIPLSSFSA